MDNNFYVTLMSNSSLNFYEENTTSSFTVHLPTKVQLTGDWGVGVAELHFPYNFFNVSDGENEITVEYNPDPDASGEENSIHDTSDEENSIVQVKCSTTKISPGFYKSVSSILEAINAQLFKEGCENNILSLDGLNGRTLVDRESCLKKNMKAVSFSARLAMQLGFNPTDNILNFTISSNIGNIFFGVPDRMLIYTDVVEPVLIGHEKAQIIKIVNTNGTSKACVFGDVHTLEFEHIHYIPVMKKEFESISVDIRSYTGLCMPFRHGVSTVKLHFKKA